MKSFITLIFTFLALGVCAQNTSGTLQFNGANYPAEMQEFPLSPAEAEKVIRERMRHAGYSPEKAKGYLLYRNVSIHELSGGSPKDVIFKVDRKSRKNNNESVVLMSSAEPGEIPSERVKGGAKGLASITTASGAGSFLAAFQPHMQHHAHNLSVASKSDDIRKAEKRLESLRKDQAKMEKKIKDLESDLQQNKKNQEVQSKEIESLQAELGTLKATAPGHP